MIGLKTQHAPAARQPSHHAARLAPSASALRDQAMTIGPLLADHVEEPVADLLRQLCEKIRWQQVKIAVIGQVKAGKSSVVNALVQRPDLLPTDVNPWTAVVTRLHLGHPSGRVGGARFRFYDDSEWRELSEAGGRLRIVSEQLLPDLDLDMFRAQLTEVRARAQRRLGPDFAKLLGSTHDYDVLLPGQLASYVAAGEGAGPAASRVFSDITSGADVFLAGEPFNLPVTVIDTPGTNDPFLVRDEITLRALDEADLTIVVLSARQAVTTADVALMRALAGLHKNRMIVFVNRCDELTGDAAAVRLVRDHVSSFLRNEFGQDVTVIAGSAMWANAACSQDAALLVELLANGFAADAERLGVTIGEAVRRWPEAPDRATAGPVVETLFQASGFPELVAAISERIEVGRFASTIASAHQALVRVCTHQEVLARQELQLHEEGLQRAHYDTMTAGLEVQRLNQAAFRLEAATATLEQLARDRQSEIAAVQLHGLTTLHASLVAEIEAFLDRERSNYIVALDSQQSSNKPLKLDISKLRKAMERTFLSEFKSLHARIAAIQSSARASFRRLVSEELPRTDIEVHVGQASNSFSFPSLAALRRVNAFHVDPRLWAAWRRKQTSLAEALSAFEGIVRQEFTTIADQLAEAAEAQIDATRVELQLQLEQSIATAVRVAHLHREAVAARLETLASHGDAPSLLDAHLGRLGSARERLTTLQSLSRMLETPGGYGNWPSPGPEMVLQ